MTDVAEREERERLCATAAATWHSWRCGGIRLDMACAVIRQESSTVCGRCNEGQDVAQRKIRYRETTEQSHLPHINCAETQHSPNTTTADLGCTITT